MREDVIGGNEGDISSEQYTSGNEKDAFESGAQNHLEFRQKIGAEIILLFPFYTKGTDLQKAMHKVVLDEMLGRLGPGHEKRRLNPEWLPACHRVTPGDAYLETFTKNNVRMYLSGVQSGRSKWSSRRQK